MGILKKYILSFVYNKKELDQLNQFPLFDGLTYHELSLLEHLIQKRIFKQGEYIYKEQFPLATLYLICEGEVDIRNGYHLINESQVLKKNQLMGIIDMFNQGRRTGEAIALKDTTILAISHLDLKNYIQQNPRSGNKILLNICTILSRFIYTAHQPNRDN